MNAGDPIEEQSVRMWRAVFGNIEMSLDDARRGFSMQNPAIIDGWERLARSVYQVTTAQTLEYISVKDHETALQRKDEGWRMRANIFKIMNGTHEDK